jgi:hypothetical protein
VYIEWLQDTETIQRVVDCCPGLEALCIECYGGNELAEIQPQRWAASLGCLTGLSTLTRLSMDTIDVSMTTDVYRAIGALTGLRELGLGVMDPTHLGPAVQLTACRQLTELQMEVMVTSDHDDTLFGVNARNKVWVMVC